MSATPRQIVYLALGPHRVRAAERHVAQLAADGERITLVVPDLPEWSDVSLPASISVCWIKGGDSRGARRLLRDPNGPLRGADLLVVGDPYAFPAAWDARRRWPGLAITLEPGYEPGRRPAPADLAVVTPWYPSANNPLAGAFVEASVGSVRPLYPGVSVLHTEDWPYRQDAPDADAIALSAVRLATPSEPLVQDTPVGEFTRIPVPISSRRDYASWANNHVEAVRRTLPTGRIEAPLVHAHTGIYGGVVALRLARPDARVVVTEHASFLRQIFRQSAARRLYEDALHRADVFLCVSQHLYDQIRDEFPHHEKKLRVVPNAIDFDNFALRADRPRDLLRWLYLGRLSEQKGVDRLLSAFLTVAAEEPAATLTLVGAGPLVEHIREECARSPYGDRVDLRPAVQPEEVPALIRAHDLLVHASPAETFGMTAVESVACGTPVLVAASKGPKETLKGLNRRAGLLVEVSEDPAVLVAGYRELRECIDELDLPAARATLVERYGREAVASRLREVYAGTDPGEGTAVAPSVEVATPVVTVTDVTAAGGGEASFPPGVAGAVAPRVVIVAIGTPQFTLVRQYVQRLLDSGFSVDVISNDPSQWRRSQVDERVRLLPLNASERRRPVYWAEQMAVYRAPRKALAVARKRAQTSEALWPELMVGRVARSHTKAARWFHRSVFDPGYRVVRPRVLWKIVRREVLPQLDLAQTERIVVAGVFGVSIGWQLARLRHDLTVTTSLLPPEPASR
ncbi:glycosyltransferase family 4 protein [Salinispora arenicola]|uniref:glycosyltransferase family 4 protein n=1 Tax=Salinispora arenicola TaxID=168697 RepID=UPI0003A1A20B|nr:glycosyltransferase family 4 protein [Salinispora arenicola]